MKSIAVSKLVSLFVCSLVVQIQYCQQLHSFIRRARANNNRKKMYCICCNVLGTNFRQIYLVQYSKVPTVSLFVLLNRIIILLIIESNKQNLHDPSILPNRIFFSLAPNDYHHRNRTNERLQLYLHLYLHCTALH